MKKYEMKIMKQRRNGEMKLMANIEKPAFSNEENKWRSNGYILKLND